MLMRRAQIAGCQYVLRGEHVSEGQRDGSPERLDPEFSPCSRTCTELLTDLRHKRSMQITLPPRNQMP